MIKKSRCLVALILALIFPVIFMLQVAATEAGNEEYDRAIVLVLDRSGSMSGEPMRALKEAANKFCDGILAEDPDCMIAIVDFSVSTRSQDYTNDGSVLESYIDSLSADRSTNMYDGVVCGEEYLEKINAKEKNMVIMADGLPNEGEYSIDGRYDYADSGSSNYKYANAIYSEVIGTDPSWRIFSLGFFHDLSGATLNFAQRFMTDLGREGYFEATDTDALLSCFEEIASNIINPLTISLSNAAVTSSDTETENYRYLLKANIENSADKEAVNVVVRLTLPAEFSLCSGYSTEVAAGNIAAQSDITLSWEVDIPRPTVDTSCVYSVSAKAENSVEIEQSDIVYLAGYTVQDNRLSRDEWWNFYNAYGDERFGPKGETYYMTPNHREALLWNLPNSRRAELEAVLDGEWCGSCYGMSSTVILAKMGVLSPEDIQDGAASIGSINKTNNDYTESYINYYHAIQFFPAVQAEIGRFGSLAVTEQLAEIEEKSLQVRNDGSPVLLCFSWMRSGHAIVGYDVETGSWRIDGVDYHKRIITYDCNEPGGSEKSYLYYNLQEGEWAIPNYSINDSNARLDLATNEIQLMECDSNIEVHTSNYIATITAKQVTELYIKTGSQTYSVGEDGSVSGDNIKVRYPFNYVKGAETESMIFVDINEEDFSVPIEQDGGYVGVKFDDSFLAAETEQSGTLNFSADKIVAVDQTEGDFSVQMTSDETDASLPWSTVQAEGSGGSVSLQKESAGVLLKSDSSEAITVEASNDSQTKSITFENYGYDVLLKGEQRGTEMEFCAFVDTDGDGEYESKIGTSDEDDEDVVSVKPTPDDPSTPAPPQESTPQEPTGGGGESGLLIAGIAALALLAIGGAVISILCAGKRKPEDEVAAVEDVVYSVESASCCTERILYHDGVITKQEADQSGELADVSVYRLRPEEIENFDEWLHSMNPAGWNWTKDAATAPQRRTLRIVLKNGESYSASAADDLAEWKNLLTYLRKYSGAPQKNGICPACGAALMSGVQMQPCGNCGYEYHMNNNGRKAPAHKQGGILVLTGEMRGALARISSGETICVGKEPLTCQLILGRDNRCVSRRHCAIAYCEKDDQYVVTDFSKNGTALEDGRKLPYNLGVTLSPGTVLLLGDNTCKIQLL